MGKSLTQKQVRLRTGGMKIKGRIIGGFVLPKDVKRDVRAGNIKVVRAKGLGIAIRPTRKGRSVFRKRVASFDRPRKGML